jgi:hypothetical protein
LIQEHINKTMSVLKAVDWRIIIKEFNETLTGTILDIGTKLAYPTYGLQARIPRKVLWVTKAHYFVPRDWMACRQQILKWADSRQLIEEAYAGVGVQFRFPTEASVNKGDEEGGAAENGDRGEDPKDPFPQDPQQLRVQHLCRIL